ncbi:hypothetical protein J6590_031189 [Homalodisca vitripennis]|nr:hypothetical protein J6590_031189 [Homalodisca vitripennis]
MVEKYFLPWTIIFFSESLIQDLPHSPIVVTVINESPLYDCNKATLSEGPHWVGDAANIGHDTGFAVIGHDLCRDTTGIGNIGAHLMLHLQQLRDDVPGTFRIRFPLEDEEDGIDSELWKEPTAVGEGGWDMRSSDVFSYFERILFLFLTGTSQVRE